MVIFSGLKRFAAAHKIHSVLIGVLATGLLGYGGWWAWMEWRPVDPLAEIMASTAKTLKNPPNVYRVSMTFDYTIGMKVTIDTTVRATDDAGYVSLHFKTQNGWVTVGLGGKAIVTKDGFYVKPDSAELLAGFMAGLGSISESDVEWVAGDLVNKWLYVSYDDLRGIEQLKPVMRCFDSFDDMQLSDSDKLKLFDMSKDQKIMNVTKRLADETVSGQSSRHFEVAYDTSNQMQNSEDAVKDIPMFKHIMDECADVEKMSEDYNKQSDIQISDTIDKSTGEIWVGKYTGEITKMTQRVENKDFKADVVIEPKHEAAVTTVLPANADVIKLDDFLHYNPGLWQ